MSEIDLSELKRLAQAAVDDVGMLAPARLEFRSKIDPAAILALIERVERAEKELAWLVGCYGDVTEVVCGERPKGVMVATTLEAVRALKERRDELERRVNVAYGWNTQNCPTAAQAVLESIVLRLPMPATAKLEAFAKGDRARASEEGQRNALNERVKECRAPLLVRIAKLEAALEAK